MKSRRKGLVFSLSPFAETVYVLAAKFWQFGIYDKYRLVKAESFGEFYHL